MFHITITHNGETEVDLDTNAIIGAYNADEDTTTGFTLVEKASSVELAAVLDATETAIANVEEKSPGVKLLRMMAKLKQKAEEKKEEKKEDGPSEEEAAAEFLDRLLGSFEK